MIWVFIMLAVLFLLSWLLFMPLVIDVDTDRNACQIYQYGTIRFWVAPDFQPHLSIFGFTIPLQPGKDDKAKMKKSTPKKLRPHQAGNWPDLLKNIYQSITVRWFHLDLDTDNVVLNAKMIPVFMLFSRGPVQLTTNFEGRVYVGLRAELKLYRIGWAFLLFNINK